MRNASITAISACQGLALVSHSLAAGEDRDNNRHDRDHADQSIQLGVRPFLGIITWSFERADLRRGAAFGGCYAGCMGLE